MAKELCSCLGRSSNSVTHLLFPGLFLFHSAIQQFFVSPLHTYIHTYILYWDSLQQGFSATIYSNSVRACTKHFKCLWHQLDKKKSPYLIHVTSVLWNTMYGSELRKLPVMKCFCVRVRACQTGSWCDSKIFCPRLDLEIVPQGRHCCGNRFFSLNSCSFVSTGNIWCKREIFVTSVGKLKIKNFFLPPGANTASAQNIFCAQK